MRRVSGPFGPPARERIAEVSGRAERGEGPGLIGQDVEQAAGNSGEVACFCRKRTQAGCEKAERVVEGIVHHPHAGCASGQRGKALGLVLQVEKGALIKRRAAGEIS